MSESKSFWNSFKKKCALSYINSIKTYDKKDSDIGSFMIEVSGTRHEEFTNRDFPFVESHYLKDEEDVMRIAKMAKDNGYKTEIWKFVLRM